MSPSSSPPSPIPVQPRHDHDGVTAATCLGFNICDDVLFSKDLTLANAITLVRPGQLPESFQLSTPFKLHMWVCEFFCNVFFVCLSLRVTLWQPFCHRNPIIVSLWLWEYAEHGGGYKITAPKMALSTVRHDNVKVAGSRCGARAMGSRGSVWVGFIH